MHIEMIDSRGNHLKTNSLLTLADWLHCLQAAKDAWDADDCTVPRDNATVAHWYVHDMGFSINGSQRVNVGDLAFALAYLTSPPPHFPQTAQDPLAQRLLRGYIEDEGGLIRQAYATLVAAVFATRWQNPTAFEWTEHSSLTEDIETEDDAFPTLQWLRHHYPDAFFCVSCYEDRAWLLVGGNILNSRMYEIRRQLRECGLLHGYSDDDDDDRAYWDIPEDCQPSAIEFATA